MTNTQDEFAQSSGYSPDKFYTASTDGNGRSVLQHVKVAPSIVGELGAIVAMRAIPEYRTPHDFYRDAFVHRLHQLNEIIKDPAALNRIQMRQDHLLAVNALLEVERMVATEMELQSLSYSTNATQVSGRKRQVADANIEAAIAYLSDRPDLQAILRAKLRGDG